MLLRRIASALPLLPVLLEAQTPSDSEIVLATTTSVRDAGLLHAILPPFERMTGYRVKVIAVGSGQAMELGRRGEADILILHDPAGERQFVAEGFAASRDRLMHNEFVLVGPPDDPAGIKGLGAVMAVGVVGRSGALFVSRADRSGTHVKESHLWRLAGIAPARPWYRESGQGMSATLQIASELGAYTLSDIGTFLTHIYPLDLEIVVEGDSVLANPYHVVVASAARFSWVNGPGARALRDYLLSPEVQRAIGAFGKEEFGRSLFVPVRPP
ncbi:MAG: solute-binding protein [Gemmatimonadales bacterium]|nr:solute-binding protein [Gemmatimonadales bacterium]NIN12905.1 solute-binding protein [Gemmatimonadales bacterium]NIR00192.1 solute-binding protein [Gemmatimonadales bacterium]NIS65985.1 solute-binding protein [Gemmatimonadales bacterium]